MPSSNTILKFNRVAAQGELTITKIDKVPTDIGKPVEAVDGRLIVGHSETGHHHTVDGGCATLTRIDQFKAFLDVKEPTQFVHEREFDTHPSIAVDPGMYEITTGREFDPFESAIRASSD